MSVLVEFQGRRYWYMGDSLSDLNHALAPLEHCDEDGDITFEHCCSESFAHVYSNGRILRFGHQIGVIGDLKEVAPVSEGSKS